MAAPHHEPEDRRTAQQLIGRLLAGRDEPSVLEREALFARLERSLAPAGRRWTLLARPMTGVLAAATVALVMLVWVRVGTQPELGVRGGGGAFLAVRCVSAQREAPCRAGARLTLEGRPPPDRPFFAAFGRRPDGVIVWYAPAPEAESARAGPLGFDLGEEHPPGDYTLYGAYSDRPLSRAALERILGPDLTGDGGVTLIQRSLRVEAP